MTNPADLIKEEIATTQEQLEIDIKKVSCYSKKSNKYKKKHKKL